MPSTLSPEGANKRPWISRNLTNCKGPMIVTSWSKELAKPAWFTTYPSLPPHPKEKKKHIPKNSYLDDIGVCHRLFAWERFPTREKKQSKKQPATIGIPEIHRPLALFQEEQLKAISAEEKANLREFAKVPRPDGSDEDGSVGWGLSASHPMKDDKLFAQVVRNYIE